MPQGIAKVGLVLIPFRKTAICFRVGVRFLFHAFFSVNRLEIRSNKDVPRKV